MSDVICNPLDNGLTALSAVLANLQALPSRVSRLAVTQVSTPPVPDLLAARRRPPRVTVTPLMAFAHLSLGSAVTYFSGLTCHVPGPHPSAPNHATPINPATSAHQLRHHHNSFLLL